MKEIMHATCKSTHDYHMNRLPLGPLHTQRADRLTVPFVAPCFNPSHLVLVTPGQ